MGGLKGPHSSSRFRWRRRPLPPSIALVCRDGAFALRRELRPGGCTQNLVQMRPELVPVEQDFRPGREGL